MIKDELTRTKLIYRYTQVSCLACVETDLNILKMLGDSIGTQNIIVLSNYVELNHAKAYLNQMGVKSQCYNFNGKLNLTMEEDSITQPPFFFLLDKTMKIHFPYKTDDEHSINSSYFRRIIDYFKNETQ